MAFCFHASDQNDWMYRRRLRAFTGKGDAVMITSHKLYPPLPLHEQVRKRFEWPKRHLDVKNIKWNAPGPRRGGSPKKGIPTVQARMLAELKTQQWYTCLGLTERLGCRRKSVQERVKILYEEGVLIRRRKTPHEYEYALAELPKQPR